VICSDKTGTLTKNEMTIRQLFVGGQLLDVAGVGFDPTGEFRSDSRTVAPLADPTVHRTLLAGTLCNDALMHRTNGNWRIKGDPTEGAFVVAAAKAKLDTGELRRAWPRVGEIPFDSDRKRMSTVHRDPTTGSLIAFVKGAPELILERCSHWEREGRREPLSAEARREIQAQNNHMAGGALRVLGVACRTIAHLSPTYTPDGLETDLTFLGLVGMIDPPRDEVKLAIRECREAGIRTVMVTGDHKLTAAAVARELGLLEDGKTGHRVLEGRDLDRMTEEDLAKIVEEVAVYARVSPEHKMKIVGAWKSRRHVVAMTGDGVNDAPALKRADIGVAMGITGTDVTKEASDMVLMDDNFATIVAAVREGRIIYDNIKKYLVFLLSCNLAEVLVLGLAGFIGWPLPLVALQILWVNLTTDGLPALALGVERAEPDLMRRPPRDPGEAVFSRPLLLALTGLSMIIFTGLMPIFYTYWQAEGVAKAQTMTFVCLILFELLFVFSCRSMWFPLWQLGPLTNGWLVLAVMSSAAMMLGVVYVPAWGKAFHTVPLGVGDWAVLGVVCGAGFVLVEVAKWLVARRRLSPARMQPESSVA